MIWSPTAKPWHALSLAEAWPRLRAIGSMGYLFVLVVFWGTALALIGLLAGTVWRWSLTNPELALIVAFYVIAPLCFLWIVVRVIRHAWKP